MYEYTLWNNRQCIVVSYMLWNATYSFLLIVSTFDIRKNPTSNIQEHFLVKIQIHVIYLNYNKMMRLGGIYSNKMSR